MNQYDNMIDCGQTTTTTTTTTCYKRNKIDDDQKVGKKRKSNYIYIYINKYIFAVTHSIVL